MPLFSGTTAGRKFKKTYAPNNVGDVAIATVVAKKYGSNFVCASIKITSGTNLKIINGITATADTHLKQQYLRFFKYIEGVIILIEEIPNLVGEDDNGGKIKNIIQSVNSARERMSKSCELKKHYDRDKGNVVSRKI
jgi:hypothetical protein